MKKETVHNILIITGSILLVEIIILTGIILSALWFIEYGV